MEIIVLKLISNEEVLAELKSQDDKEFVLRNPVGVAIVRGSTGQPSVGFAPFPLHAEQKSETIISIDKSKVIYHYAPAEDFVTNYNQIFGSGIVLPSKQLITG